MPLRASIVGQSLIGADDRDRMLDLHRRYFDNVRRDVFLRDMAAKDWVIVLRDAAGTVAGFSTIRFVSLRVADEDCLFLFSGDTVVDQKHRQCGVLAGAFGHVMLHALEEYPTSRCYWYLISKGYRTYRFLPLYFRRFYPSPERPTPSRYSRLLGAIGHRLFGDAYDGSTGIVRHAGLGDRLAREGCDVPRGRSADPHVRYFARRNPHYAQGDELACIADVATDNFGRTCWRVIERTAIEWVGAAPQRATLAPMVAPEGRDLAGQVVAR